MLNNNNLWAPWRGEYMQELGQAERQGTAGDSCFLCDYVNNPEKDAENLVLWRGKETIVLFNRFPYTAGHLLVAPKEHLPNFDKLSDDLMLELMISSRDCQRILTEVLHPHGFNVGFNVGKCSGAGLPGHIHMHIVPRWDGDTNFMTTLAGARLVSQSLEQLYKQMRQTIKDLGLPYW